MIDQRVMLNLLVAGIVMQLIAMVKHTKKHHSRPTMSNLLPYLAQLIIRLVPSLQGSAILLGSTVRQCSDKLAF